MSITTYAWGHQDNTLVNVAASASVITTGQVPTQWLTAADVGEVIDVSVQAKNGSGCYQEYRNRQHAG